MAYGGLINAFSSGLVDGARAGALMDATFADQDQRELESQARDVKGFVDYLAASGNDFNKALETPEGQQMAYRAMAANPAVRKSLASAPGFKPTGMVRGPDGRFAFVGQDDNGNIRPLSVGGKAVTYDSDQLMAMTAASAGQLGVDNTAQQHADVEQLAQGDVFDTLEQQGLGPATQLRQMAQQGQQFIEQGGIPVQKGGVPAVRQAIRAEMPKTASKETPVIKGEQASPEKVRLAVPDMLRRQEPAKGSDDPLQLSGKSFSDIRREAAPTLTEQKEKVAQNREDRRTRLEAEYQQAFDESSLPRDVGAAARAVVDTAGDVGEFVGRGVDYFRRNVTKPAAAAVEKGLEKAAEIPAKVKEGFTGEKAPVAAVAQTEAGPVAAATAPGKTTVVAPQSTVEKAVAKQHLSPKMVATPEKLEQVDAAFVKQIKSEPLQTRVQNDGTALERLAKLGQGKKPNSAQLHAVFRLVKSGLLTPAAAAMFRETGKLDNTAFDNAYKEHNVRQNYMQLQQADNRLAFDKYKEVNDQARHLQGVRLSLMKENLKQGRLDEKAAAAAAKALDKKGTDLLANTVAAEFRRMPAYKDLSGDAIKAEAETAVQYMLADGQYVAPMLGGRTVPTSMPDYVALAEAIPELVGRRFGKDGVFSSSVAATPVFNKFKNAGRSIIGEE